MPQTQFSIVKEQRKLLQAAPIAPEDEELIGVDVEDVQIDQQGAEIPQGQVVIVPERGDHLVVNGVSTGNRYVVSARV